VLKQSQVVLTTTGPFALYGDNVVAQAVEQVSEGGYSMQV
jgi:short subunit dehydrogenase-like uncharacterized protein